MPRFWLEWLCKLILWVDSMDQTTGYVLFPSVILNDGADASQLSSITGRGNFLLINILTPRKLFMLLEIPLLKEVHKSFYISVLFERAKSSANDPGTPPTDMLFL